MERAEAIVKLNELRGQEMHSLAEKYKVTIYKDGKVNKGWAGHVFERHLELPINSAQSPNFGSWELKSFPIKRLKNGDLQFKETMAITMIDPINVMQKEFKDSHLLSKLKKAVVVGRTVGNTVDEESFIYKIVELNLKDELYDIVENDYNLVRNTLIAVDISSPSSCKTACALAFNSLSVRILIFAVVMFVSSLQDKFMISHCAHNVITYYFCNNDI